jgi:ABC-type lipoprotein export system ATPase subunit
MISKITNIAKDYLRKKRESVRAIDGVSFDINEGDFISIVGPSGSGKTTLLSIIGCLIQPTRGDVYFNDKKVTQISDKEQCKLRGEYIGFIFQFTYLVSHLTVLENVLVPLMLVGEEINEKAKDFAIDLLTRLDMQDKLDYFPRELSGGEIQRTAIARSLIKKPKLLLADEPTGDLDFVTSQKIFDFFKELNEKQGVTIVVVTHNPQLAKFAKDIYQIDKGKVTNMIDKNTL